MLSRLGRKRPGANSVNHSSSVRSDLPSSLVHKGAATWILLGLRTTGVVTTRGHQARGRYDKGPPVLLDRLFNLGCRHSETLSDVFDRFVFASDQEVYDNAN